MCWASLIYFAKSKGVTKNIQAMGAEISRQTGFPRPKPHEVEVMKFDVTKLSYGEIEKAFSIASLRGIPFYISKLGRNVVVSIES